MTPNEIAIACLAACTGFFAVLAFNRSLTEKQNTALFEATGELRAPRWIAVLSFIIAVALSVFAIGADHHSLKDDSWIMALFGTLAMLYVSASTLWGIRLDLEGMRFGLACRKNVAYSDIVELERKSTGRDAIFFVILRSGKRARIGTNLPCEKLFCDELQKRSGCKVSHRMPGGRVIESS
jgi:hypothetical protein